MVGDARYAELVRWFPERIDFWPIDLSALAALARHGGSQGEFLRTIRQLSAYGDHQLFDESYVLTRSPAALLFVEMLSPARHLGYRHSGNDIQIPAGVRQVEEAYTTGHEFPVHLADIWASWTHRDFTATWLPKIVLPSYEQLNHDSNVIRIGVFCDAGEPYRMIPVNWLGNLLNEFRKHSHVRVTLLGNQSSTDDTLAQHGVLYDEWLDDKRGMTTLTDLCYELTAQDIAIGPDTGGLHLAAMLGTTTIGLYFGGARAAQTGPYAPRSLVFQDPEWDDATRDSIVRFVLNENVISNSEQLFQSKLDRFGIVYTQSGDSDSHADDMNPERANYFDQQYVDVDIAVDSAVEHMTRPEQPVTIVVPENGVSHYTDELLLDLKSELSGTSHQVILVLSGKSAGRMIDKIDGLNITCLHEDNNLSFAAACNIGARHALQERLLFLNNDVRIPAGELRKLLLRNAGNQITSPVLLYADGTIQNTGVEIRDERIIERDHGINEFAHSNSIVDAVSAVAMLIPRQIFMELNGFDEQYVNGYEDLDFCLRAAEKGISSSVDYESRIIHFRGSSEGRHNHESENLRLFVSRWHDKLKRTGEHYRNTVSSEIVPLLIISDQSQDAAGSRLRWGWPLNELGWQTDRNYLWITTAEAESDIERLEQLLDQATAVIVFRPLSSQAVQSAILRRKEECILIVDSDDLVLNRFHASSQRACSRRVYENAFCELLNHADLITASTEELSQQLRNNDYETVCLPLKPWMSQLNEHCRHNYLNSEIRIGFMGSQSHLLDLGSIIPALELVLEANPQARFYWWGCRPGALAVHPQVRMGGPIIVDYKTHLDRLHRFDLDIAVVPLLDAPVNRVKTPLKYFEYALAGIPAVFSNIEPYASSVQNGITGLLVDDNTNEWVNAITVLVKNYELRNNISRQALTQVTKLIDNNDVIEEYDKLLHSIFPTVRNHQKVNTVVMSR
ncbi:MAG: glycosyltransferase [Calditrichota bacterium]